MQLGCLAITDYLTINIFVVVMETGERLRNAALEQWITVTCKLGSPGTFTGLIQPKAEGLDRALGSDLKQEQLIPQPWCTGIHLGSCENTDCLPVT